MHAPTCIQVHTCIHAYMHVHAEDYILYIRHLFTRTYVHTCGAPYPVYMYTCTYVHAYFHAHARRHTHTHRHTRTLTDSLTHSHSLTHTLSHTHAAHTDTQIHTDTPLGAALDLASFDGCTGERSDPESESDFSARPVMHSIVREHILY